MVEAKRTTELFKLPTKGNHAKLRSIYSSNKDVVDQIRGYLFEKGLAYGVITNGTQFIIGNFVSVTGLDWRENECRFYKDIEDVKRNFIDFYNLLSFSSISSVGLIKITSEEFSSKIILRTENLPHKDSELVRNQISNELIPVINRVFEEIYHLETLESRDVLERCYVSNEDFKKYNSEIEHLFSDSAPTFDSRITRLKNTKNTQESIASEMLKNVSGLPAPIILIGTAGCGKTTFIKYFTEIVLDARLKQKRPIVYVDFRLFTSQTVRDTKFIYQRIITSLEDSYPELELNKFNILKTIYKRDIEKKSEGTWSHLLGNESELNKTIAEHIEMCQKDPLHHLRRISNYLIYQCGKRLCIIFDNADQLNDDDQKEVFILGNSINRELQAVVLISLREGYFYKWKNQPPFNAYQSLVYHISAPSYKEVLRRRIDYVTSTFDFTPAKIQTQNKSVTFQEGSLKHLFKTLYETLFNRDNSDVLAFLENTSYPNIRQGLETFKSFLLSGHSKFPNICPLIMAVEVFQFGNLSSQSPLSQNIIMTQPKVQ